ncbi:MAG: hypothetical protein H6837_13785 [Planctomycetes bacterium]|nr:hypothetical protein [Planctomycetota bacterium]
MIQRLTALLCLLGTFSALLCCHSAPTRPPQLAPEVRQRIDAVRAELQKPQPDLDGALVTLDGMLRANPRLRPALLLSGEANIKLAVARPQQAEALLGDASRNLKAALDLDRADAGSWLALSEIYFRQGEFEQGRDAALAAAEVRRDQKAAEPELAAALLWAAHHETQIFVRSLRAESDPQKPGPATLERAQHVLSRLEACRAGNPSEAYLRQSWIYAYLGRGNEEFTALRRGVLVAPESFALHDRLRTRHAERGEQAECVATYKALLRDHGNKAGWRYALGQAQMVLADKLRNDGNRTRAIATYTQAAEAFTKTREDHPEWRDQCDNMRAIQHLAMARMYQESGETEQAKDQLKRAYTATPRVLDSNQTGAVLHDSFGGGYGSTLNRLGQALGTGRSRQALAASLALWEEFIALHPGKLAWLYNNAAFDARDLGIAIEAQAARAEAAAKQAAAREARAIYERSYELYKVAAELEPDNARIVNDTGLVLVYNLGRDHAKAESLFAQAIRVGRAALEALPADTTRDDRHRLEEAVGDAYWNTAYTRNKLGRPFAEYKEALQEAVKYFPYQQREAARWLRNGGAAAQPASGSSGGTTPAPAARQPDSRGPEFQQVLGRAAPKAAAGDFDGALLELDKVAKTMQGYPPFHYHVGLYSLRYAQAKIAPKQGERAGSASQIDGLLTDARNQLQRAVELDGEPIEPRLHLAQANLESGEMLTAAKLCDSLLTHISSRGGASGDVLAETHRIRALAGNQLFTDARFNNRDDPDQLAAARNAFRALEKMNRLPAELCRTWSVLEQRAKNNDEALAIYARALQRTPNDVKLLGGLVTRGNETQDVERAAAILDKRTDALGLFYSGMARYHAGTFAPLVARDPGKTNAYLRAAVSAFTGSMAKESGYGDSCSQWIAIAQAAQGFAALATNPPQVDGALRHFLDAARIAPARFTAPVSGERSVKTGIQLVVDQYYRKPDLPGAIAALRQTCAVFDGDADLWNNLGLFCRDHGVALETAGKPELAKKLFEQSLTAYDHAVHLAPTPRHHNDKIVLQLYHLNRDTEAAAKTLRECIVTGEKQLAEDPPQNPQQLRDLQETVGDCYQNLGYYLMKFAGDPKGARSNFEKSLTFHPFKERSSNGWLAELDKQPAK